jgi:hypothetical protein
MIAPGWLIPAGIGGVILVKAWDWFLTRRSQGASESGQAALLTGLREEVQILRDRQMAFERRLEMEIKARQQAEAQTHKLQLRIETLEALMIRHKIPIPPASVGLSMSPL